MKEHKMEELIIDYIDGNLTGELKSFVEKKLSNDALWQKEYQEYNKVMNIMENVEDLDPDTTLKSEFDLLLQNEIESNASNKKERKTFKFKNLFSKIPMQFAASITILIIGVYIGMMLMKQRNDEINELKQLIVSMNNQSSASTRLKAVNTSSYLEKAEDNKDIITALIQAMNNDSNINVRLAAIEALEKFSDNEIVRANLIKGLNTQDNPIVQIALINLMVKLKEKKAVIELEKIIKKKETLDVVKDEAHIGLFKLS